MAGGALSAYVFFVEGTEVGDADRHEVADLDALLIIGEHGGIDLAAGHGRGDRLVPCNREPAAVSAEHAAPAAAERATEALVAGHGEAAAEHESRGLELGLMLFSVLVGATGIFVAYRFYVRSPEISERLAQRFAGPHRILYHKYYVDEFYDATVISENQIGLVEALDGAPLNPRDYVAVPVDGLATGQTAELRNAVREKMVAELRRLRGRVE